MSPRRHALLALAAIVIVSALAPFHGLRLSLGEARAGAGPVKNFPPD